jgi:type IV secretory pathway VirB2 component (pilin)
MASPVTIARWIALPFEVGLSFVLSAIAAFAASALFTNWPEPVIGFGAACGVVCTAYWRAPRSRLITAGAALLVGSAAATYLLRHASFPEGYAHPYQQTLIPLYITLSGGIAAFVACVVHSWIAGVPSNNSLERTREG